MAWNYQRNETKGGFKPLPVGDYRIRIQKAELAKSQKGRDMLVLVFEVSGQKSKLFHRITFLEDRPDITNRNLTQFFDAFPGITDGDFNTANWVGKVGACHTKMGEYNGEPKSEIHYFIHRDKQGSLPAWVEPEGGSKEMLGAVPNSTPASGAISDDELPPF